jgi:hypothetical protein
MPKPHSIPKKEKKLRMHISLTGRQMQILNDICADTDRAPSDVIGLLLENSAGDNDA